LEEGGLPGLRQQRVPKQPEAGQFLAVVDFLDTDHEVSAWVL